MRQNLRKRKSRLVMRATFLALCALIFMVPAKAQTPTVLMKDGNFTIQRNTGVINFYDSHGPSQQTNYWESWYNHNENFTFVFKPAVTGDKIKVTFKPFRAYAEPADPNSSVGVDIGYWTLRLNEDYLTVYDGNGAVDANEITSLTGNTQMEGITFMSNGAMTFKFTSNERYREEGWYATVELVTDGSMAPQAPFIQRSTCSDQVEIFPTTLGARIIYSIGNNDPAPGDPLGPDTYEYTGPISFPEGTIPSTGFKVNAMSQLDGGTGWSTVSHAIFYESDRVPIPDADDNLAHTKIERLTGTNTIVMTPAERPAGLNDTYEVRYTVSTNGTEPADPTYNNSTLYTGPITCTVNGTIYKAKTFAVSCHNQCSEQTYRLEVEGIYAPAPVIDLNAMTISATEGETTFDIIYTLDGSIPSVDPITGTYSAGTVNLTGLTPGQTVRAIAYRANNDTGHTANTNYTASQVVSAIYVPSGGSGTYGGVVLLDDREDHTWAYYSNENSPIKSLNPADVKITYFGNGTGTINTTNSATPASNSWTQNATGVQISNTETENQFIYLKTLERTDGSTSNNPTGRCEYTTIANPFSKRPTYQYASGDLNKYCGFYGWRIKAIRGGKVYNANGTLCAEYTSGNVNTTNYLYAESQCYFEPDAETGMEVELEALWARAYVTTSTSTSGLQASDYERNFMVLGSDPGSTSSTAQWPTTTSNTTTNGANLPIYRYNASYQYSLTQQIYTPAQVGAAGTITQISFYVSTSQNRNRTLRIYLEHTGYNAVQTNDNNAYVTFPIADNVAYSGTQNFNTTGWHTITLTTPFYYDGVSNLLLTVCDDSNSNHSTVFGTYSSGGTRAVYVGWDSATDPTTYYYPADGTSTYNNQIRFTKSISNLAGINVPLTITTYNPDGTGGSTSVTLTERIKCAADLKIENIKTNIPVINASGHDLVLGRGVTGTVGTLYGALNFADNTLLSFRLRLESGTISAVYAMGYGGVAADQSIVRATLGSDYDRAKKNNDLLKITDLFEGGYSIGYTSSANTSFLNYDYVVKSGKMLSSVAVGDAALDKAFYMGYLYVRGNQGGRRLLVEGGELKSIAGGFDTDVTSCMGVDIRIKGGSILGSIYGAAAYAGAVGDRRFVITGGTVNGWIAGGCNGTTTDGGQTDGDSYIYFGGNAQCTSNGSSTLINSSRGGNIFGAGSGIEGGETVGQINNSTIVIADNAQVEHNVYGGGNYGYVATGTGHKTNIHVLGGTVSESVFGGSNQQQGQIVNIWMKDGTITGNLYGGSNSSGTVNGLATINMSGGSVKNVFGGGCGASTIMSTNGTKVTVTGGTISENLYGGGENGDVNGQAIVSFEDGSVTDVYGAGKGTASNVAQGTTVNVKGGVVNGSVFGGGENGTVAFTNGSGTTNYQSIVTVSGGEVKNNVFGGGYKGTTQGKTTVNITGTWDGTVVRGDVFAGAYGQHGSIFVAGLKTLNISGGRIYGSVYGGSRDANDGNTLNATGGTDATSITNISGGRIDQHVFAAGYYGSSKGSVYAFIGLNAINDAPHHSTGYNYPKSSLLIGGSVWAGGDWGVFTGTFGAPTISGNSNIYINGEGYSTESNDQSATNYMNIQGSIMGCGSSCDAGEGERVLILSHYGIDVPNSGSDSDVNPFSNASRQVSSIQRFHNVIFDDAHIGFVGLGKINSLNTTEKFALYEIDQNVYLANGSTIVMNVPSTQIYSFHNVTIDDAYTDAASAYHVVPYNGLGATGSATDNKIRVNGGSYLEIKYVPESTGGDEPGGNEPGGEVTLTYDFEDNALPSGWTNEGSASWSVGTGDYSANTGAHGGNYNAKINHGTTGNETYLVTQSLDLSDATEASLNLWYINRSWLGDIDGFAVCYRVNGGSWNQLFSTTDAHSSWTEQNITLTGLAANYQIGFKFTDGYGYGVGLDDITISYTKPAGDDPQEPEEPTYTDAYGELSGYAHMMAGNPSSDATCAYARPKQSKEPGNILPESASDYFNNDGGNWTSLAADGGWVSYRGDDNDYDIEGNLVSNGNSDQLRYENHYPNMRNNSEYYRIWRHGGNHHHVEAVVTAHAEGNTGTYKTVEVEVQLPSWGVAGSYYRFDRTNNAGANNTLIEYGSDVMTFNGANYSCPLRDGTWMYFDGTTQQTGVDASNATVAAAIGDDGINDNPNLNFGLVIAPGQTMKNTDANYIITSQADTYLASVEKPFNCDDNLHMPTVKLILTYSDELSANATLDPVHIYLVQCSPDGSITDYVDIEFIINTSMNLTSGFTTQIYARMDGSLNTRETTMVPVVLPTFNVAESGENARFYLEKVDFVQNEGVVIVSSHGSSVVCAEARESASSSGVQLNIDRFAMTIGALANPDNTDDWRNVTGPQDAVQQPNSGYGTLIWGGSNNRGVHLGDGKGRNPLSFGITLYYNSNEEAPGRSKMGDMVFTIRVENIEGGTGTSNSTTFTITVEVWRLGPGDNFYVDGINGQDLNDADRAKFPDKAAKTINFIFNRLGYMPGDNIFVVNELPITTTTTWDGSRFQNNVKIYRYPGGHRLTAEGASIIGNPNNDPYMNALVDVTNTLNMKGVTMDGMYLESTAPLNGVHNSQLYPTEGTGLGNCTFDGIANAPLITVSNGARVNLTNTKLQNNYNNSTQKINAGGAVHVTYEGILAMNVDNDITGNYNANGGGVYVDGSMIVSDYAYIWDNYTEAVSGSKADPEQNNVELEDVKNEGSFRVVQIGTSDSNDAYNELVQTDDEGETKIGVSKDDWDHAYDGYMPVVYAESGTLSYLNDPFNTQQMVVHDGGKYKLERYVTTEYSDSPNYLYWLETWVTAVTEQPEGFNKDQIDTPEELAWAISLVNGENGCSPDPNMSFTLTGDVDMKANIWVPIGNETALYNGTFEGNGHVVEGLRGTITRTDMGMFGRTNANAKIQNMVVCTKFNTNSDNLGTVVGNMTGGTLSNVEGAGENTSRNNSATNGGLVGINSGTIHSSFAVTTITGGHDMGGLVAINNGDLINAYSAAEISGGTNMAGLVAANNGRVENCYNATNADVAFAVSNKGSIKYCYTAEAGEDETITYVSDASDDAVLEKHGTYGAVLGRKALGYMYGDNKVTANGNSYVKTTHEYLNNHTVVWDGLLSVLNQWVADGSIENKPAGLSTWNRPLTQDLNGDLPVLAFPKDNCFGNLADEDGKILRYSASDNIVVENNVASQAINGLDHLLGEVYSQKAANVYLYGSAIDVVSGTGSNNLFIHEDAALVQKKSASGSKAMETIEATVGVTYDNSSKSAHDYWGTPLSYDWHLMSTPLSNAKFGVSYKEGAELGHGKPADWDKIKDGYMPDMINSAKEDEVTTWDFYTYFEPEYHWINFKRSQNNHWHYDAPHDKITYTGTEQTTDKLTPGRGYIMAISKDSYLSSNGTLNNDDVPIALTVSGELPEEVLPSKDWGSNLVGNPYQAYLDLDLVQSENFPIEEDATAFNGFYVYDAENETYGPYITGASVNNAIPSKFIHPHQAFFVVTKKAKPEFKFTYNMATATPNPASYFRSEEQPAYPVVNLFAKNEAGNRDLAIIELNRPELGGVRKVNNLRNATFKISAHLEGQNYGLMFTPVGTEKVPVHFDASEDGVYTLTWSMYNGDFTSLRLIDNKTGVNYDMLANDHYTFEASADDYASRFYITYTVTDVDENVNEVGNSFAFFNGSEWVINGKGHLDVIDVTGRVLYAAQLNSDQNRVNLDGIAKGVYLLRVIDNKVVRTQKIIVR